MDVRWDAVARGNPFGVVSRGERVSGARSGPLEVHVWLFGMLRDPNLRLPVKLQFESPPRLREVIGRLVQRLSPDFAPRIVADDGTLHRHCRAFVEGAQVESPDTAVRAGSAAARVEFIVLTAAEGG